MTKYIKHLVLFTILYSMSGFAVMAAEKPTTKEKPLEISEIIFDHMGDAYEWSLFSWAKDKSLVLPLPIIVYSKESGMSLFSSAQLRDGAQYKGFKIAPAGTPHQGKVVEQRGGEWKRPLLDLSMTKIAFAMVINSLIVIAIILMASRWYRRRKESDEAPGGFVGFIEMLVMMLYDDIIKTSIKDNPKRFAPYLLTIFFFILINNLMSLVPIFPGGVGVTGNIAVTAFLALCTFLAVNLFGTKEYWKEIFWPDVPLLLKVPIPILPIIELMGVITKPFALMIRLFANMMAGHMSLLILVCLIFIATSMGPVIQGSLTVTSILFTLFMNVLELLVAFIQAYVFTLLSAVYIGLAQEGAKKKVKN